MSDKAITERFEEVGRCVMDIGRAMEGYRSLSVQLTGMTIRGPKVRGDEYLLILKGLDESGAPVVCFISATSLDELMRVANAKLSNGTLKWRADDFAR